MRFMPGQDGMSRNFGIFDGSSFSMDEETALAVQDVTESQGVCLCTLGFGSTN